MQKTSRKVSRPHGPSKNKKKHHSTQTKTKKVPQKPSLTSPSLFSQSSNFSTTTPQSKKKGPVPLDSVPLQTHMSFSPKMAPPSISSHLHNTPPPQNPYHHTSSASSMPSGSLSDEIMSNRGQGEAMMYGNGQNSNLFGQKLQNDGLYATSQSASGGFFQTISNTELFYPATFSQEDIRLVEEYSRRSITTFGIKSLLQFGHPKVQNAIMSAAFLAKELPSRYAQRIELLRDFPFEVNRHPLVQQIQEHYLESLRLITSIKRPPETLEDLHSFNKVLLQLVYQSSLLPSSTLSHALCTAFGDILLQQLMMGVAREQEQGTNTTGGLVSSINPSSTMTQQIPQQLQNLKNSQLLNQIDFTSSTSLSNRRDTLFTMLDDNTASLTLFNSVLQEVLDSFNVSRLDTRLVMQQHSLFCQQLFKHLNIECDYPLVLNAMAPAGHDEFGLIIGSDGKPTSPASSIFGSQGILANSAKNPDGTLKNELKNEKNHQNHQNEQNNTKNHKDIYSLDLASQYHSIPSDVNVEEGSVEKKPFSAKEGYDGFIGIIETNLSFPKVIAQILPYAAHQGASRYANYTLERSFQKMQAYRAKMQAEGDGEQRNNDKDENQQQNQLENNQNSQNNNRNQHENENNEKKTNNNNIIPTSNGLDQNEDSDYEPLSNKHSDQNSIQALKIQQRWSKSKKNEQNDQNDQNDYDKNTVQNIPNPPPSQSPSISPKLSIQNKKLSHEFHHFSEQLLLLDRSWAEKVGISLMNQFENNITPHPTIPDYQSIVFELPPLEINVPAKFYQRKQGQNGNGNDKNDQNDKNGQNEENKNDQNDTNKNDQNDTNKNDQNGEKSPQHTNHNDTTKILIPFPKLRLSGHLDHKVSFPRPHANLVIRELISNAVENTIKNTLELTHTTTRHLIASELLSDFERFNDKELILKYKGGLSTGKARFPEGDPRHGLITGGLLPEDYTILNNHAQIPPIEMFITKASSRPSPKKEKPVLDGNFIQVGDKKSGLDGVSSSSPHKKSSQNAPRDDILSIKIADRANGLSQRRAKAVLTYGNALIQGHLQLVRTYKEQQQKLNEFNNHIEQLRTEHYAQYNGMNIDPNDIPPFLPPELPRELQGENLVTVNIPTADKYGPTALEDMCSESHTPRGFGLPLAKATVHYLHGEMKLNSIDGFGTDVYIRLRV